MLRKLFLTVSRLPLRTTLIALFAFHSVFFASAGVTSACTPVAYLFRHAEDENKSKTDPFGLTLTAAGEAHADLYIEMLDKFQQDKSTYCPIKVVYALNPENFDGSFGTSNLAFNLGYGGPNWGNFISANGLADGSGGNAPLRPPMMQTTAEQSRM